jgi:hypothetical protein
VSFVSNFPNFPIQPVLRIYAESNLYIYYIVTTSDVEFGDVGLDVQL